MPEPIEDRTCEHCGRWVEPNETMYCVRVEVFAEPTIPPFDPHETREQANAAWERLLARLEKMSDDEVREASDQVYERYAYNLCATCRAEMHRRIRLNKQVL